MTSLLLHVIEDFIIHILPLLSFIESPIIIRSHILHRGSLHLETDGLGLLVENSAFVNKCFRFSGCCQLIIIFVLSSRFFISDEFEWNFKGFMWAVQ